MSNSPQPAPHLLLNWLQQSQEEMLRWIRQAVEIESPSFSKPNVDRMGEFLAAEFLALGGRVKLHRRPTSGDHLQIDFPGGGKTRRPPILLLGHHDTVWDLGTLKSMRCRVKGGRLYGPGALDMKGGLAEMFFAIKALHQTTRGLARPVTILSVTDEETGSDTSRAITEALAKKCAAVFVLEPAMELRGALKTSRKGVGDYVVKVQGVASHSGVDFEAGASAIVELARQIEAISKFTDLKRGVTVNPGVVRGGTRTNVIAAHAEVEVDIRLQRASDAAVLKRKFGGLRAFDKRCKLTITGGVNRPPMERSRGIAALFAKAQSLAAGVDRKWKLAEAATGGGSDGNFTAALGIPTLDGLGSVGEGAHAPNESIVISEIPRRTALLAALIAEA